MKSFIKVLIALLFAASMEINAQEIEDIMLDISKLAQVGNVELTDQAVLRLPEGFYFVPKELAARLMYSIGNTIGDEFLGLVLSDKIVGFITIDFFKTGYIKDSDAKNWDTDELLEGLKKGTEFANKERVQRGFNAIEVLGWVETPFYDSDAHRLIWSASLRDKGSNAPLSEQGVNYNTYLLGREGYLSLNLVTDMESVGQNKPFAKELLASTYFNDGKRYEDFDSKTDYIAEFGLAALIGGVAAKKLGILAAAGVLLVKFWKILIIALIAFGVGFKKFFKNKNSTENTNDDDKHSKDDKNV
ncbi:MAG: DUF2167 domain-containing protein [Campylobacteraceae bacterium]|nr:DUF2167 domain-containing protein [Campylobacteraceae bacterium]